MSKFKVRKGDEVVVLVGRSKGMTGKIDKVDTKFGRVFVGGLNLFKKHQKPTMNEPNGGIVDKPMSVHVSNVSVVDPKTKKASRVGYKVQDGKKIRVAKESGSVI